MLISTSAVYSVKEHIPNTEFQATIKIPPWGQTGSIIAPRAQAARTSLGIDWGICPVWTDILFHHLVSFWDRCSRLLSICWPYGQTLAYPPSAVYSKIFSGRYGPRSYR